MKRSLLKISSMMVILLVMISSMGATAFAAEDTDELSINSAVTAQKGDVVTMTINLADCDKKVVGLQMYLSYDNTRLKYVDGSLKFEKFDGVVYNAKLENQIAITWTNVMEEVDFSKKASFLSLQFAVVGTGETSVSQYISHMYDMDMTTLSKYTFTYDYAIGDDSSVTDMPAVITSDESFLNTHTGSFVNYDDGMGENSPSKDSHIEIKGSEIVTKVIEATRYEVINGKNSSSNGSGATILIIIGVVVVVLAIIAVIIVKKRDESKKQDGENSQTSDETEN